MPSIQPTPSNNYLIQDDTPLDPDTLNAIFGSISGRLKTQEAQIVDWEAAVDNLNNLGLQVIAENLAPQILAARDQVTLLQSQANAVEDQIAALISAGIFASGVTVTPIAGLNAANTTVQLALASLLAKIGANGEAITALAQSMTTALGTKQTKLTWSKKTTSFNAVAGNTYLLKHSAALTVTFPAAPAEGDRIGLVIEDEAELYAVTIALSGKSFAGATTDVVVKRGVTLIFEFFDGAWRLAA